MSELYNTANTTAKIRRTLLATASAIVLAAPGESALASDTDRPTVWIEGGAQFESIIGESDPFVPPLEPYFRELDFTSLTTLERELGRTYGGEGSISFQPKDSDWVFSASVRYGRVQTTRRSLDQKVVVGPQLLQGGGVSPVVPVTPSYEAYRIGYARNRESHVIADFQIGKDIGIGLLGHGTDSIINFGVRYAQMSAASKGHSYGVADIKFQQGIFYVFGTNKYSVQTLAQRSFAFVQRTDSLRALGPSLSLKNATGLLGTVDSGQLALDWGVNAALLFGRQKAKFIHHPTIPGYNTHQPAPGTRSRMVTVPNVGGFAGLSYRFTNAKISAGYRADFFFNARDGGLETRNAIDVGFHGPFATISIGLGG